MSNTKFKQVILATQIIDAMISDKLLPERDCKLEIPVNLKVVIEQAVEYVESLEAKVIDLNIELSQEECEWKLDDNTDYSCWESSCGQSWVLNDGDLEENNVNYCQGCGGKVITINNQMKY